MRRLPVLTPGRLHRRIKLLISRTLPQHGPGTKWYQIGVQRPGMLLLGGSLIAAAHAVVPRYGPTTLRDNRAILIGLRTLVQVLLLL